MLSRKKMKHYYDHIMEDKWRYNQRFRPDLIHHPVVKFYTILKLERIFGERSGKGMRLLDLGCGTGFYHHILKRYNDDLIGVDFALTMLDIAKGFQRKNNLRIPLINTDVESLPFKENSFDLILCMDLIHHIHNIPDMLNEISRVLDLDGSFVSVEVNPYNLPALVHNLLLPEERGVVRNFPLLLKRHLKRVFRRVSVTYVQFLPFFLSKTPPVLLPLIKGLEAILSRVDLIRWGCVYMIMECSEPIKIVERRE